MAATAGLDTELDVALDTESTWPSTPSRRGPRHRVDVALDT
jgi:hypothetical protein